MPIAVDLDQRRHRHAFARARLDERPGALLAVHDHAHFRATARERGETARLLRHHADRVKDVAEAVVEEILGLAHGGHGDRARGRVQRALDHLGALGGLHVRAQHDAVRLHAAAHRFAIALELLDVEEQRGSIEVLQHGTPTINEARCRS
jgi:hypothetical protein